MNILLIRDIVQIISQYSREVYCTLRLVNKEVKEMVDEVLPAGVKECNKEVSNDWRVKFLRNDADCGFKLLDGEEFDAWIRAMDIVCAQKGDVVEKFCRDYYAPRNGIFKREVLRLLCMANRKDYVQRLWNEAVDKKKRFCPACIEEICMLDDLEFVKTVHEYSLMHDVSFNVITNAVIQAITCFRWTNVRYLVEKHPELKENEELKWNDEFTFAISNWNLFRDVESCRDKDVLINLLKQNGLLLLFANESLRSDKEITLVALKANGWAIKFINEEFRKDKEVIMTAVKYDAWTLRFADDCLRKDKQILLELVKQNGLLLHFAHESLRKDKHLVMEAVKQDGNALEFAHESLRKDKHLVMEAVKQNGLCLKFADDSLETLE